MFSVFLCLGVWQDLVSRRLNRMFLVVFGCLGCLRAVYFGEDLWKILISAGVGLFLLIASHITDGKIGEGDGWFFVVSGLYLQPSENLLVLISGLFFCSIYCLVLVTVMFTEGRRMKQREVPFLPFLLPVGLWLAFS